MRKAKKNLKDNPTMGKKLSAKTALSKQKKTDKLSFEHRVTSLETPSLLRLISKSDGVNKQGITTPCKNVLKKFTEERATGGIGRSLIRKFQKLLRKIMKCLVAYNATLIAR